MIEISSITQLPSDWCDILTKSYNFVVTVCTKIKYEEDLDWHKPILELKKKSEHIYCNLIDEDWHIVVDEDQITEELLPKYIEELNRFSPKRYRYISNPNFFPIEPIE